MSDPKLILNEDRLSIKQVFNAPIERLFACFTQPDLLSRWHAPGEMSIPQAQVNLEVGGQYRIVMQNAEGQTHTAMGCYKEIDEPNKLVYTWSWENREGPETLVTVLLTDKGEETEVELIHEGFTAATEAEHHSQGWTAIYARLGAYINA